MDSPLKRWLLAQEFYQLCQICAKDKPLRALILAVTDVRPEGLLVCRKCYRSLFNIPPPPWWYRLAVNHG